MDRIRRARWWLGMRLMRPLLLEQYAHAYIEVGHRHNDRYWVGRLTGADLALRCERPKGGSGIDGGTA